MDRTVRRLTFAGLIAGLVLAIAPVRVVARESDAPAQTRAAIERLVDDWYAEHCAGEEGRPNRLMAPGAIDASPGYRYVNTRSAAAGPRAYTSLAATLPLFRHEITDIRADAVFAKVRVRERGYRYAWRAGVTYELMGDAVLVVERQDDGRWLVLAHESHPVGFPPSLATVPLPDLGPEGTTPGVACGRFTTGEHAR